MVRTVVVVALSSICIAMFVSDIMLPWQPMSVYGFNLTPDGEILGVAPGYAAAAAGLRDGDRVDLKTATPNVRRFIGFLYAGAATPGNPITFVVHRGDTSRTVTLLAKVQERSAADNISDVILILSELLFGLIAGALVLLRPSPSTWAFFLYGISTQGFSNIVPSLPVELQELIYAYFYFISGVGIVAFVWFALRFPGDSLSGRLRVIERALIPAAAVLGIANTYMSAGPLLLGVRTGWLVEPIGGVFTACAVAGVATIVWKFATSKPEDRQRIKWVIFGLVVGFGTGIFFQWFVPEPTVWQFNLLSSANVLFPITLAYAVVRHRVIDVNFVVSRTLVYGAITGIVIAIFGVIDWFFNSYLSLTKAGTIAEITSAIGLGFWLKALHGRVDTFVDAVFFRRRHEAEVRLLRLARALPHATTIEAVQDALVDRTANALDLTSAAMFLKSASGEFSRARSAGWEGGGVDRLAADDVLVIQLSADQQPLSLSHADYRRDEMPVGVAHPALAVPVTVRNELRAVVLYGPHRRGDDLDPDEVATLASLAVGASAALDHAEASRLRKEIEASTNLSKEVEAMRVELTKLRAALAT